RNHGALTVGNTVGEAFNWMHRLELSCRSQLAAMAANSPLRPVSEEVLQETWNNYQPGTRRPYGVIEWPALLRKLDRTDPSYRAYAAWTTYARDGCPFCGRMDVFCLMSDNLPLRILISQVACARIGDAMAAALNGRPFDPVVAAATPGDAPTDVDAAFT